MAEIGHFIGFLRAILRLKAEKREVTLCKVFGKKSDSLEGRPEAVRSGAKLLRRRKRKRERERERERQRKRKRERERRRERERKRKRERERKRKRSGAKLLRRFQHFLRFLRDIYKLKIIAGETPTSLASARLDRIKMGYIKLDTLFLKFEYII